MRAAHLLIVSVLLLSGCASGPQRAAVERPELAWRSHHLLLQQIDHWHLAGRIAATTNGQGWNARLLWEQEVGHYRVQLRGPLGQGAARLEGDDSGVVLVTDNGELHAATPEAVLYRQTGWQLPVSGLRYWILGMPVPHSDHRRQLDRFGQLATLEQDGWSIRFQRYHLSADGLAIPDRLVLDNDEIEVRLVIDRWRLDSDLMPQPPSRPPLAPLSPRGSHVD